MMLSSSLPMYSGFLPVFDFIGTLHNINIHPDLELNVRRDAGGPGVHVHKDETCPEFAILQQVQSPIRDGIFIRQGHEFVKDNTLGVKRGIPSNFNHVFV